MFLFYYVILLYFICYIKLYDKVYYIYMLLYLIQFHHELYQLISLFIYLDLNMYSHPPKAMVQCWIYSC